MGFLRIPVTNLETTTQLLVFTNEKVAVFSATKHKECDLILHILNGSYRTADTNEQTLSRST